MIVGQKREKYAGYIPSDTIQKIEHWNRCRYEQGAKIEAVEEYWVWDSVEENKMLKPNKPKEYKYQRRNFLYMSLYTDMQCGQVPDIPSHKGMIYIFY